MGVILANSPNPVLWGSLVSKCFSGVYFWSFSIGPNAFYLVLDDAVYMCNTAHERLYIHRTVGTLKIVVERTVYCEVQRRIEVDRRMFIEQLVVLGHIVWYSSSSCQLSRDAGWSACVLQEVSSAVKEWPLERRSVEFDLDAMILCLLKINIFSGFVFIKGITDTHFCSRVRVSSLTASWIKREDGDEGCMGKKQVCRNYKMIYISYII